MRLKLVITTIFILLAFVAYQKYTEYSSLKSVGSYESCMAAKGSLVQETYPATCITRLGSRFTQPESLNITTQPKNVPNWLKYTNTTNNYSIQYPKTWHAIDNVADLYPSSIPPATFIFEKTQEFAPGISIWVTNDTINKITYRDWIINQSLSADFENINLQPITIDDKEGFIVRGIPGPFEQEWIFVTHKDKTIIIYLNSQSNMSDFYQILSTFKFTD